MYFNRTGGEQKKIGRKGLQPSKIFKAEFKDGKWTNVTMLPFSSDEYSVEHPALSKMKSNSILQAICKEQ